MKTVKWFSQAMTLGFIFFMALLLVNPANSIEFVAMIPVGAFIAYLFTDKYGEDEEAGHGTHEMAHKKMFFFGLLGGLIMSYGAMLADGGLEGNIVSGVIYGTISSYAFVLATLLTAIPVAILMKEYSERRG